NVGPGPLIVSGDPTGPPPEPRSVVETMPTPLARTITPMRPVPGSASTSMRIDSPPPTTGPRPSHVAAQLAQPHAHAPETGSAGCPLGGIATDEDEDENETRASRHCGSRTAARTAAGQSGGGKHVPAVRAHSAPEVQRHSPPRCVRRHSSFATAHAPLEL